VAGIKRYLGKWPGTYPLKVTTDKLAACKNALQTVFKDRDYVHLQIVKKRVKIVRMRKVMVIKWGVWG